MTLTELIQQNAIDAANAGDFDAVARALNEESIEVLDPTYYTSRHLVTLLGVESYRVISGSLASIGNIDPLIKDIHQTLNTTGIDFSDSLTQVMIDEIGTAAKWSAEMIATLKGIGRSMTSLASRELGMEVTPEQCQAAWTKSAMLDWLENRRSNALSRIQSGEITSVDDLKKFVGE